MPGRIKTRGLQNRAKITNHFPASLRRTKILQDICFDFSLIPFGNSIKELGVEFEPSVRLRCHRTTPLFPLWKKHSLSLRPYLFDKQPLPEVFCSASSLFGDKENQQSQKRQYNDQRRQGPVMHENESIIGVKSERKQQGIILVMQRVD